MKATLREGGGGPGRTPGLFEVLRQELKLRNYSHKPLTSYRSWLRDFVRYFAPRHPRELGGEDVRKYLLHLIDEKHFSAGSINQAFNAIRFLYVELYKSREEKEGKTDIRCYQRQLSRNYVSTTGNIVPRSTYLRAHTAESTCRRGAQRKSLTTLRREPESRNL